MLYFGSLAISSKPFKWCFSHQVPEQILLYLVQGWSSHTSRKEKEKKFLPAQHDWHCHPKGWGGRDKLVAKRTNGAKLTGYYYGTVLHSWNVLGEYNLIALQGK